MNYELRNNKYWGNNPFFYLCNSLFSLKPQSDLQMRCLLRLRGRKNQRDQIQLKPQSRNTACMNEMDMHFFKKRGLTQWQGS